MSDNTPMITVKIDGQSLSVPKGYSIIQAADEAGIVIPRFCYHKKLSVAANCRMCLVDVEGARKPTPACATPAGDNMVISTKSQKTIQYQKSVMEFLLLNHPLDCPICDQGGECELQDVAMGYGSDVSQYTLKKRVVPKKDIGPLIETDLTRCIHCTRCVRFGKEVAGVKELGMIGRGEHSEISTFLDNNINSEMSGNVIDLCPVGALTSKPFRYSARAWEMQQKPTLSPHDSMGSHLFAHVRQGKIMRVVPRENENLNETWLSDRDRFSYEALNNLNTRAQQPKIKKNDQWEAVSWEEAILHIVTEFNQIAQKHGSEKIGAISSASSSTESQYLLQKFIKSLGSNNTDHRAKYSDDRQLSNYGPMFGLDIDLNTLEKSDCIILIGSDCRTQQPILHHRLRQASLKGAKIITINPSKFERRFESSLDWLVNIDDMGLALAECLKLSKKQLKSLPDHIQNKLKDLFNNIKPSKEAKLVYDYLLEAQNPVLLCGEGVQTHSDASVILALFQYLKLIFNAKGGLITEGANTQGAWISGMVPHLDINGKILKTTGHSAQKMLSIESNMQGLILLDIDPRFDCADARSAKKALLNTQCVVSLTAFETDSIRQLSDVILPIGTLFETDGCLINNFGQLQTFKAVSNLLGEAKPAWKVLRVLGNYFDLADFDYESVQSIQNTIQKIIQNNTQNKLDQKSISPFISQTQFDLPLALPTYQKAIKRWAGVPLYAQDMITRHAPALQLTQEAMESGCIVLNAKLAQELHLENGCEALVQQGDGKAINLIVKIVPEDHMADQTVCIPQGLLATRGMGHPSETVSIVKV